MAGKGDKQRPSDLPPEILDLRYDLCFGNPEQRQRARQKLKELGYLGESDGGE